MAVTARSIEVAGVVVRFSGDADADALIDARYGAFASDHPCNAPRDVPVTEVELRLRPPQRSRRAIAEQSFRATASASGTVLEGAGVRAEVSADLSSVRLSAPLGERPVDAVLRFVLAARLLQRGALLVHASAVVIGGRAWVFAGPSGVGKSTLGKTLRGDMLCDEAVALGRDGDELRAHATPYWQARPGSARVAGVIFPRRGGSTLWEPLTPARAVARLASCVGPLLPESTPRVLAVCEDVLATVPAAAVTLPSIRDIRGWLQPLLEAAPC